MRIGKRLFPYPILNNEKIYSQYKNSVFSLQYDEEVSEDKQYYLLNNLHCELDNQMLIDLINADRAKIVCVIECPSTMYRMSHVLPLCPINMQIPLTDLNNKVNISAFVVAKEDIENYRSDDFSDIYEDISFSIEKHDILAADDGYVNNVDFNDLDDNFFKDDLYIKESFTYPLSKYETEQVKIIVHLKKITKYADDDKVGEVTVTLDEENIFKTDVFVKVKKKKNSWIDNIKKFFKK